MKTLLGLLTLLCSIGVVAQAQQGGLPITGGRGTNTTLVAPTLSGASMIGTTTNTSTFSGTLPIQKDGIGSTPADALIITNSTAAAAGAQQYSPAIRLDGFGWATTGSSNQPVSWRIYTQPVQGTGNPSVNLLVQSSVNGAAYSTRLTIASTGALTPSGAVVVGGGSISTSGGNGISDSGTLAVTGASTLGGAVTATSILSTNGFSSLDSTATAAIAATGYTNTLGKLCRVFFNGTAMTYTIFDAAASPYYTNAVALTGSEMVILQASEAVTISGTGVAGVRKPL